ncbi:MAG: hypothetical protein ABFD92_02025 [Planctomycetaceae bacterium]
MKKTPSNVRNKAKIAALLGDKPVAAKRETMRHFAADEHIAWVEANCYRDTKGIGWQPCTYRAWQRDAIRKLLAVTDDGLLRYLTIMPCFPRRCDKSGMTHRYDIHRCLAFKNQVVVIQANSADQAEGTVFGEAKLTLQFSPALRELVDRGEIELLADVIHFHKTGSRIEVLPASEKSTYGRKIHVYHNTELCKAPDDSVFQTGASSTGDAWCGVTIVDSNMGDATGQVAQMRDRAEAAEAEAAAAAEQGREIDPMVGDPTIGCVWIHFADLADCLKRGCGEGLEEGVEPIHPWLSAAWVRGRYANMTRGEFLRNHCNIPSGSGEALWSAEQIDPLFDNSLPAIIEGGKLDALRGMLGGTSISVGVGLDRASAFSKTPDRSVLAAVARVVIPGITGMPVDVFDERGNKIAAEICDGSMYMLIGAWEFMYALADPIKDKLLQIDRTWGIGRLKLEAYQASDLWEWCKGQRFGPRTSADHMTSQAKLQLVTFMHNLVITRRFKASPTYSVLRREFTNYREDASTSVPSFGGKRDGNVELDRPDAVTGIVTRQKTWIKDDYLEATLWAVEAARDAKPRGTARVLAKPAGW